MKLFRLFILAVFFLVPLCASAAQYKSFEVSGWIPWWRTATGTTDTLAHIDTTTEVNPFVYTLNSAGEIIDNGAMGQEPWLTLKAVSNAKSIRFIPTVMNGDGDTMHRLLSNTSSRIALEDRIAALVKEKGFDGIDIDFEGKKVATREYFSTFLKGLDMRLKDKWLMCTIESRTPVADRYFGTTPPPDAGQYANDLQAINQYCDRVRIMAYDQQGIDLKLADDAAKAVLLYAPVGDPRWVEKVVNLMSQDIAKNKIMIGVPTYGYGYDVTAYANNEYVYDILWTFNPGYAIPIASQLGIVPERNAAGEIFFTYVASASSTPPIAGGTPALAAAAAASQMANANNSNHTFRMLTWPDAESVRQKIELAKRLGVRGVSIFKFDGGQDPNLWNTLATYAAAPQAPSVPGGTSFKRTLTIGSRGEDVRALQILLNSNSQTQIAVSGAGSPGSETTLFGSRTRAAVQKFQVLHGIIKAGEAGYGLVGPKTRAALNSML